MKTQRPPDQDPPDPDPASLRGTLKRFPRPVWVVFLGVFINRFGTFVVPFLALHLTRLGYSVPQAGLALAAYGAGHLVASLLGGHLADTIGRRNTIVLSMFSGAVSMLCLSQAEGLAQFVLLAGLAGITSELYKPAASALLGDLIAPADRVTAYAAYRFAINAGWAIGPATAGLLARHSYFWLFAGDAVTSLAFGLIAWRALPRNHLHPVSPSRENIWASLRTASLAAFRDRCFFSLLIASFAVALVFMQMPTTFGLEVKAAGYPENVYGLLLALNGVLIILFELPISAHTRRRSPRRVIAAGYALLGGGLGLLLFGNSVMHLALAMAVFTFGEMISMPVAMAYAAQLAPDHLRGRYMGVYGLTWGLALTCGPAFGMMAFAWNRSFMWTGCVALGCLGAAIMLAGPTASRAEAQPVLPPGTIPALPDETPIAIPASSNEATAMAQSDDQATGRAAREAILLRPDELDG